MKYIIPSALLYAIIIPSYAQSNIELYGIVDTAIEHLNNTANGNGLTRLTSLSGRAGSRLGFRGEEKLSRELTAIFTMEMGIAPDSGNFNQGGRVFGRQSWLGLKTHIGTIGIGRQYTMLLWGFGRSDVTSGAMHGLGALDSYLAAARVDNSVSYRHKINNFDFGLTYSFGRDSLSSAVNHCSGENASDSSECTQWSAMIKYDTKEWGASLAVDEYTGGPRGGAGLISSELRDRRILLNGYLLLGRTQLGGGILARKNDALGSEGKTNIVYLGVSHPLTERISFDAQVATINNTSNNNDSKLFVIRSAYAFSKRTSAYTSASFVNNGGNANYSASSAQSGGLPEKGNNQLALAIGLHHKF